MAMNSMPSACEYLHFFNLLELGTHSLTDSASEPLGLRLVDERARYAKATLFVP